MLCTQILQNARVQLEQVVRDKLAAAISDGQHSEVVRFAKLFKPLRIQVCARPAACVCMAGFGSDFKAMNSWTAAIMSYPP